MYDEMSVVAFLLCGIGAALAVVTATRCIIGHLRPLDDEEERSKGLVTKAVGIAAFILLMAALGISVVSRYAEMGREHDERSRGIF